MRLIALILATVGVGYLPGAPGTYGSALAVGLFWALAAAGLSWPVYLLGTLVLAAAGVWAATTACRAWGTHDDGRVVIDEVVGQLLALLPLLLLPEASNLFLALVTGFVLFRVLDIWKPGPVRWAERRFQGGLGVMADDLLAGAIGAVLLATALWVLSA